MKTVSQLGTGTKPVGTTSYMGRIEYLMQCRSDVKQGKVLGSLQWIFIVIVTICSDCACCSISCVSQGSAYGISTCNFLTFTCIMSTM